MSNWIYGKDLIAYWNIEGFEFFNCLKKGLQPYTSHGHKIIDTDSLERGREQPLEWYIARVRASNRPPPVEPPDGSRYYNRSYRFVPLSEQEIARRGRAGYEAQPLKLLNPPRHSMSFTLPLDSKRADLFIRYTKHLLFKKDEVNEFAEKHRLPRLDRDIEMPVDHKEQEEAMTSPSPSVLDSTVAEKEPEYESFVRSLRVLYGNDFEVKIREPRKKVKTFNHETFDFREETDKGWIDFRDVIRGPDRFFRLGPSSKKKGGKSVRIQAYDTKRKRLLQINTKFVEFLKKEYHLEAPETFKIYEKAPEEGKGVYKFKFLVGDDSQKSKYDGYPKEKWHAKFDLLSEKYKKASEAGNTQKASLHWSKMKAEITEALLAQLITKQEATDKFRKEDEIFDPQEIDVNQRCENDPDIHNIQQ